MKKYFAFDRNVATDCGILPYEPPVPHPQTLRGYYLASDVDARIAELESSVERLTRVKDAALRYYVHWMQDEADDPTVCTERQHKEAAAVRDALEAWPSEKAKQLADAIVRLVTGN